MRWKVVRNIPILFVLLFDPSLAYSPVCDSYVRPETLVRICDECNFGTYGGRCIICGSPGASSCYSFIVLANLVMYQQVYPTRTIVQSAPG